MKDPGRTKKKITAVTIAAIAMMATIGFGMWHFTNSRTTTFSGTPESIVIGTTPYESTALIDIADDQGYFSANTITGL